MSGCLEARRSGTGSQGNENEILVPAVFSLKLAKDPEVTDFSLQINVKNNGALDDVAVSVNLCGGREVNFIIQLKHREKKGRQLQVASLEGDEGNLSLKKYRDNFDKLTDEGKGNHVAILYSNLEFYCENTKKMKKFDMEKSDLCFGSRWFDLSEASGNIYNFRVKKDDKDNSSYGNFFEHFSLYVSQKHIQDLKKEIINIFKTEYLSDEDTAKLYIDFFRDWYYNDYSTGELRMKTVVFHLLCLLLKPSFSSFAQSVAETDRKFKLVEEAINKFDVTLLIGIDDALITRNLHRIWIPQGEDNEILKFAKASQILKSGIKKLIPEDRQKVLTFQGLQPLFVKCENSFKDSVYEAIKLLQKKCAGLKILLIGEGIKREKLGTKLKIFENLYDLQDFVCQYNEVFEKFEVSLQGRGRVCIKNVIGCNKEIAKVISARRLVENLGRVPIVGEELETIPDSYILRTLRQTVKESIACGEWTDRINLICAKPGMGKSTIMKRLKNNCSKTHWAIRIDFNDHQPVFQGDFDDKLGYFLDFFARQFNYDELSIKIMHHLVESRKCYIYWDGLDELDTQYVDSAIRVVQEMQRKSYHQWLSARTLLRKTLEDNFKMAVFDIEEISVPKQKMYIKQRLKGKTEDEKRSPEEIDEILEKLYNGVNMTINNKMLGTPLQLYIITEVLLLNPNKSSNFAEDISVLPCLYRNFMEGQFVHYLDKAKVSPKRIPKLLQSAQTQAFNVFYSLALKSCFKSDDLTKYLYPSVKIVLDFFATYLKNIREEGDYLGIIIKVHEDNSVIFGHKTYMEFFAAWWMADNREKISELKHVIFREEYGNVRYFFDLILAEKFPPHLAVLYRNYEKLEELEGLDTTDAAGRTPLHLICSWGIRHPILKPKSPEVSDQELSSDVPVLRYPAWDCPPTEEVRKHVRVVRELSTHSNSDQIDCKVFNWTATRYADHSMSLSSLEGLSEHCVISLKELEYFNDPYLVSYYCIEFGYQKLLKQIAQEVPFFYVERPRHSLYDHALDLKEKEIAGHLLSNPSYFQAVEAVTEIHNKIREGRRPSWNVFSKEVDSNSYDRDGNLTLQVAVENYSLNVIYQLVDRKIANVYQIDISGRCVKDLAAYKDIEYIFENNYPFNLDDIQTQINLQGLDEIIKSNLVVRDKDKKLSEALFTATMNNSGDIVTFLIENGVYINKRNYKQETALMKCAAHNNFGMVKMLIENYNADFNVVDYLGQSAVFKAIIGGYYDIVKYLIDKGAMLKEAASPQWNLLHHCAKHGYLKILKLLVEDCKLKIDKYDENGNSELLVAASYNFFDIVQYLITKNVDIHRTNLDGMGILSFAAGHGDLKMVQQLVEDHNFDGNKQLAVLMAAEKSNFAIVEYLIQKGASTDVQNQDRRTLLWFAAKHGNLTFVQKLVEERPQIIDRVDRKRDSALIAAAMSNNFHIVDYLLEHRANPGLLNNDGDSVLSIAATFGKLEVVRRLMEEFGPTVFNLEHRKYAHDCASENNHFEVAAYLAEGL